MSLLTRLIKTGTVYLWVFPLPLAPIKSCIVHSSKDFAFISTFSYERPLQLVRCFYYLSPTKLLKVFILSQSHICTVPPNSFSFLRFSFICVYVHACVSMCESTHLCVSACCFISLSDYLWITSPQITMQRLINTYESFAFSLGLFPTNFYNLISLIFPPINIRSAT